MRTERYNLKQIQQTLDNQSESGLIDSLTFVNEILNTSTDKIALRKAIYLRSRINTLLEDKSSKIDPKIALFDMYKTLSDNGIKTIRGKSIHELHDTILKELMK